MRNSLYYEFRNTHARYGDARVRALVGAVGSFGANTATPALAQLKVWGWDGAALTLKQSEDWYVDGGATAWNVATGDVDKDGVTEIVTVGCTALSNTCDPDMRIWSIAKKPNVFIIRILGRGGNSDCSIDGYRINPIE